MADFVELKVMDGRFAVVKLPLGADIPRPPKDAGLWSETVTDEEISLICPEPSVPVGQEISVERTWRCLKVIGPLEFELKGILAGMLEPLAEADISVFALSTYLTDYILVKERHLERATTALLAAGHCVY